MRVIIHEMGSENQGLVQRLSSGSWWWFWELRTYGVAGGGVGGWVNCLVMRMMGSDLG